MWWWNLLVNYKKNKNVVSVEKLIKLCYFIIWCVWLYEVSYSYSRTLDKIAEWTIDIISAIACGAIWSRAVFDS